MVATVGRAGCQQLVRLALVLALGLAAALALGLGAANQALATPVGSVTFNYTRQCPSYSIFQGEVANVGAGFSAVFTFAPGLDCVYSPANGVTSGLAIQAGATITIDGNGLVLDGSTTSTPANFDIIDILESSGSPSTLSLNQVTIEHGHYGIVDDELAATVNLTASTISGNASIGLFAGKGAVTNSTISDNYDGLAVGSFIVTDSTISGNAADGIGIVTNDATLVMTATILAGNTQGNCVVPPGGSLIDDGYNLSTDTTCGFGATGSQNSVAATGSGGLNLANSGNLGNYGGPTQTIALGPGSITIDAIPTGTVNDQTVCLNAAGTPIVYPGTTTPVTTDQRGVTRPQGSGCDIGAYELIQGSYTQTETTCPTQAQLQNDLDLGTPGADLTIALPANCTIDLTSPLTVNAGVDIALNGDGLTLAGANSSTDVIDINDGSSASTLSLTQVTLENGKNGIYESGSGTVTLTTSTITGMHGAGLLGDVLNLTGSTVSDGSQDAVVGDTVTLGTSSIVDNQGFGVETEQGDVTVTGSTISGNLGMGIDSADDAVVTGSTIAGNGSYGVFASNVVTVTNSTITGNKLAGIYAFTAANLTDSTLSGNQDYGLVVALHDGTATMTATILADNGTNCAVGAPAVPPADGGYNLSTDSSCGFSETGSHNSVSDAQLNLLPLDNYGGPTQTFALGLGSDAVDAIPTGTVNDQTVCLDAAGDPITDPTTSDPVTTDQRGIDRPQGPGCDIGAYEVQQATLTPLCTQTGLSDALNQEAGTITTIDLPANCTIDLSSPLTVGGGVDITINGNGLTLVGANTSTDVIDINDTSANPSTLTVDQVTIENGYDGINDQDDVGTVTLTRSIISDNQGHGVVAGNISVAASTVSDNGGVGVYTANNGASATTVTDSTISGNGEWGIEGYSGYSSATMTLVNDTISGNAAAGVYVASKGNVVSVSFTTIADNTGEGIDLSSQGSGPVAANLTGTILANNGDGNCELYQTTFAGGYNLSTDTTCGFSGTSEDSVPLTGTGGLNLLSLGSYGGPTQTVALGSGSIAIDQIPVNAQGQCALSTGATAPITDPTTGKPITTDQRGVSRPQGSGCDIGAYEAPTITLTPTHSAPNGDNDWYTEPVSLSLSYGGLETGAAVVCTNSDNAADSVTLVIATADNQSASGVSGTLSSDGHYTCGVTLNNQQLGVSTTSTLDYKIDSTNPVVQCTPPDQTVWYASNQTVDCTASDAISGLDDSSLAGFSLTTNVGSGSASASAATTTQQVCDVAGNCVTAGPYDFKVDREAPTVQASAKLVDGSSYTFGDWTNQAVTVSFSGSDGAGSGVKSISYTINSGATQTISGDQGSFTLSNQGTDTVSYWATDNVGNTSAPQSVTVELDLHAPGISITAPSQPSYTLMAPLTAGYRCSVAPGISPVSQCSGTVTLPDQTSQSIATGTSLPTSELGSYTFTVTAENAAGNASSQTVHYVVGYTIAPLAGTTTTVNQGYYAVLRFAPEDANGHDYASRSLTVTSVSLDGTDNQVIPFAHQFDYGTFSGKAGYQLEINTRNLAAGSWSLLIQIGSGKSATTGTITFTVN